MNWEVKERRQGHQRGNREGGREGGRSDFSFCVQ